MALCRPRGPSRPIMAAVVATVLASLPTTALAAVPSNDSRSGATEISTLPYSTRQDVEDATSESTDPRCYDAHRTVWYRYVAAADGELVASTIGSSYGTSLEVLEVVGPSRSSMGCEYDPESPPEGVVKTFPVSRGRTYLFVVGWSGFLPPEDGAWDLRFSVRERPQVDVDVDRAGFVSSSSGQTTLTGTTVCSEDVLVDGSAYLHQGRRPHRGATAYSTVQIECTTTRRPFMVRLPEGSEKDFRAGTAHLFTFFQAREAGFREQTRDGEVRLTECTVVGSIDNDVLRGTAGADRICALYGDDEIRTGRGNDVVDAGPGRDLVRAGSGDDRVAGGAGADRLLGNSGRDVLLGDAGRDRLVGGKGYDRCTGGTARDTFRGCEARRN